MLDATHEGTIYALRLLRDAVDLKKKPVILWVGAGVSQWCGYPNWNETAEEFHANYVKFEQRYERVAALMHLKAKEFPKLFDQCRSVSDKRYHQLLVSTFGPKPITPVYAHFLKIATQINPVRIVTTNIDTTLEHNVPGAVTVERSDLERCLDLIREDKSFIAKMHGSASSVKSIVFTATDYETLVKDTGYLTILQHLFLSATVIFIGYGLRDQYILDLLAANHNARILFGDGPHFAVTPDDITGLPESIKQIRYLAEPHTDHRSSIAVLDIVRCVQPGGGVWFAPEEKAVRADNARLSSYFISDIIPPGTWESSQTLGLARPDGTALSAVVGQGFVNNELPDTTSHGLHDLAVGLLSFDTIHVPLSCISKLHVLLGGEIFWKLVRSNVFRFVNFQFEPCIMFPSADAVSGGDIGVLGLTNEHQVPATVDEQITRQLKSAPGREREAVDLFEILKAHVATFDTKKFHIPSLTRGALLHPVVRQLLGISEAALPTSLPRWAAFPALRLAHTIMAGCACEDLRLASTKIAFGGEILVGAAFSVAAARDWADTVASYAITGRFNTELGAFISANPSTLTEILAFRETQDGQELRREILEELMIHDGTEFVTSVNAGLRRIIPSQVMERARNQLSSLLFNSGKNLPVVPAVWTNIRNSDDITARWRQRSRQILDEHCRVHNITQYDLCPCGSGEKLRFCCAQALR